VGAHHQSPHGEREQHGGIGKAIRQTTAIPVEAGRISGRVFSLMTLVSHAAQTKAIESSQVMRKPLVWCRCSRFVRSELSPCRMAWQPSSNEICKLKSCSIFISAGFRPGISKPFLMRRMRRIGSISAPTFSSKPRMNAAQTCETGKNEGRGLAYVAEFPSTLVGLPTNRRHFGL
jgi:hypothetical protein